jgi:hypothetical protein
MFFLRLKLLPSLICSRTVTPNTILPDSWRGAYGVFIPLAFRSTPDIRRFATGARHYVGSVVVVRLEYEFAEACRHQKKQVTKG